MQAPGQDDAVKSNPKCLAPCVFTHDTASSQLHLSGLRKLPRAALNNVQPAAKL